MSTPRVDVDFSGLLGSLVTALSSVQGVPNPANGIRPGGFPDEIFTDLTDQEKRDWECSICYLIVRGAKRCANNHLFCATCILTWALSSGNRGNGRKSCPVCRLAGHYKPDFSLDRKVARKYTKCPEKGCDWTGKLRDYRQHCRGHGNPDFGEEDSSASPGAPHGDDVRAMLTMTRSLGTQVPSGRQLRRPQQDRGTSEGAGQSYSQLDTRIRNGRHRLEHLFANFNGRLERRGRDIQRLYDDRESQRVQQLQEVNDLGVRLSEVSTDLMYLLGNMSRDSERYQTYIRQSTNIETAIQELSDSVAAVPLAAQRIHGVAPLRPAGGPPQAASGVSPQISTGAGRQTATGVGLETATGTGLQTATGVGLQTATGLAAQTSTGPGVSSRGSTRRERDSQTTGGPASGPLPGVSIGPATPRLLPAMDLTRPHHLAHSYQTNTSTHTQAAQTRPAGRPEVKIAGPMGRPEVKIPGPACRPQLNKAGPVGRLEIKISGPTRRPEVQIPVPAGRPVIQIPGQNGMHGTTTNKTTGVQKYPSGYSINGPGASTIHRSMVSRGSTSQPQVAPPTRDARLLHRGKVDRSQQSYK